MHGFVAVVVSVDLKPGLAGLESEVISRGWVEKPALVGHQAAVADAVESEVRAALSDGGRDPETLGMWCCAPLGASPASAPAAGR